MHQWDVAVVSLLRHFLASAGGSKSGLAIVGNFFHLHTIFVPASRRIVHKATFLPPSNNTQRREQSRLLCNDGESFCSIFAALRFPLESVVSFSNSLRYLSGRRDGTNQYTSVVAQKNDNSMFTPQLFQKTYATD
jgi:hypothetical protein